MNGIKIEGTIKDVRLFQERCIKSPHGNKVIAKRINCSIVTTKVEVHNINFWGKEADAAEKHIAEGKLIKVKLLPGSYTTSLKQGPVIFFTVSEVLS